MMDNEKFQKLLQENPPLVLAVSKRKVVLLLILFILFAITSAELVYFGHYAYIHHLGPSISLRVYGWIGLILSSLGIVILLKSLILPYSINLTMDTQGFTIKGVLRSRTYLWEDVSEFVAKRPSNVLLAKQLDIPSMLNVSALPGLAFLIRSPTEFIMFNHKIANKYWPSYKPETDEENSLISLSVAGLNASQLAQLMNYWRERFLPKSTELNQDE